MLNFFSHTDAHIEAELILDAQKYEIEHFEIDFSQSMDYKGQPQHEVAGGQMHIGFKQGVGRNIYEWAKKETMIKDGLVRFYSESKGSYLEITFTEAYCVRFSRIVNNTAGTSTSLVISPKIISLGSITHHNNWK